MNVASIDLPFYYEEGMSEQAYLEALCSEMQVRVCRVASNGSCFFESICALLPTIGKAVKSPKILRLQVVQFFRECHEGQHGDLGERIMLDVEAAMQNRIVSSCAQTRCNNKKPKSLEAYFDAVSLQSVWVEGMCAPHSVLFQACSSFLRTGFHWLRAIAHLFHCNIVLVIYRWTHAYVFGEANPSDSISLWKSDVETHFEPLIPMACKCTLPRPLQTLVSDIFFSSS
jgi:hypothetical protein